jgi:hypothetical protein
MLNVTLACGATTRIPYNGGQPAQAVVDAVRGHEKAALPAPGRERAFLAAAVNSVALASPVAPAAAADPAEGASTSTAVLDDNTASASTTALETLIGKVFTNDDAPFPPRQLQLNVPLEKQGVVPEGRVFVVFLAPQELRQQQPTSFDVQLNASQPAAALAGGWGHPAPAKAMPLTFNAPTHKKGACSSKKMSGKSIDLRQLPGVF